jgi:hypothetical protein
MEDGMTFCIRLLPLLAILFLCGCGTDVSRFYNAVDPRCETMATKPVRVYRIAEETPGSGRSREMQMLLDEGFVRIGDSSFDTTGYVNEAMIVEHAEKIGAGAVVYYVEAPVTSTYDTVIPIYNQGQTYNSTFRGYGAGGPYYGTVTTTGPDTLTMMPTRVRTTTQGWVIAFMAKRR